MLGKVITSNAGANTNILGGCLVSTGSYLDKCVVAIVRNARECSMSVEGYP